METGTRFWLSFEDLTPPVTECMEELEVALAESTLLMRELRYRVSELIAASKR